MQFKRKEVLGSLASVSCGLSKGEVLEQSQCFVFVKGNVLAFNGEIMARKKLDLGVECAVPASELLALLNKIPDEEIGIEKKDGDLVFSGKKIRAGVKTQNEIHLPYTSVPIPKQWMKIDPEVGTGLIQASRASGNDETMFLSTCVHLAPGRIEGCDNYRLYRRDITTGVDGSYLIPGSSIRTSLQSSDSKRYIAEGGSTKSVVGMALEEGWIHFRTKDKTFITVRCVNSEYQDLSRVMKVDGTKITLPETLKSVIERAQVMVEGGAKGSASTVQVVYDSELHITIADGKVQVESRKETGWYKERHKIKYSGPDLDFWVNPNLLCDMLSLTSEVVVGDGRMKFQEGPVQFVVSLKESR